MRKTTNRRAIIARTETTRLLITLLAISFLLLNCRSRTKEVEALSFKQAEVSIIDTFSIDSTEQEINEVKRVKKTEEKKAETSSGEIEIKGSADAETPFTYENIVNGDTLQSITITGNADFIIKNYNRKEETVNKEETVSKFKNIISAVARTAVAKSTIKDVAKEIKSVKKATESKGFVFPVYLIIFGILAFILLLLFLWNKFGGPLLDKFNRRR